MDHLETISICIGWGYFVAWSASFYPQLLLNYSRKSVKGLSFDFLSLNLWGFLCYTIYNASFYLSETVRKQYRDKWGGSDNIVQLNDVVFAVHAALISGLTVAQTCIYTRSPTQKIHPWARSFIILTLFGAFVLYLDTLFGSAIILDVLYYLSFVKMAVTTIKYAPQAYYNHSRKSTSGWSIHNILLDFTGGLLSLIQLFIDSKRVTGDYSGVYGNPVKLGLSLLSMMFDVLFMVQHYILYPNSDLENEEDALLSDPHQA
ncbi:hypothetical protein HDV05_008681 [Chytridiales sp. JEL 0842]|nr:hypothetical protein HDV05_008681 [Chytridiales sp. JEL 0842]